MYERYAFLLFKLFFEKIVRLIEIKCYKKSHKRCWSYKVENEVGKGYFLNFIILITCVKP